MGKRYYCDYCDRSFKDDYEARKKHLSSAQHINNRLDHYLQFKDPGEILACETQKTPCKKIINGEQCAFGNNCKFSHYTQPMIWELQKICAWRNYQKIEKLSAKVVDAEVIINKYFKNPILTSDTQILSNDVWRRPAELQNYSTLPPSLVQISPQTVTDSNFADWGH